MNKTLLFLVVISLLGFGCTESPIDSEVKSPFSIKHGQRVILSETGMAIEFDGPVHDSRCPLDVQCIWPGFGTIQLRVSLGIDTVVMWLATAVVGSPSPPVYIDTLGYHIELTKLDPYPESVNVPIADSEYVATLSVTESDGEIPVGQVLITDIDPQELELAEYHLDSARVEGETMTLWVNYGGGCEAHYFQLYMSPAAFAESEPVQVFLYLRHFGPDDYCQAYIHDELRFDLAPIGNLYRQQYGHSGEVRLNFRNCTTSAVDCINWTGSYIVPDPLD